MRLLVVTLCTLLSACATTSRVDPALFEQRTFALASVHARSTIDFQSFAGAAPLLEMNELGTEALEMELGEGEVRLGEILGVTLLPPGKALQAKKAYDLLPEAQPPEAWTQVNDMTAVDLDDPRTPPALGGLARALHVDAAVVLRHEWALVRDRFEMTEGVTIFDRCSVLVVDKDGRKLWEDTVVARAPVMAMFAGSLGVGFNGATWGDEAVQHARRTARMALDELARRYEEAKREAPPPSAPPASTRPPASPSEPPPPLDPAG